MLISPLRAAAISVWVGILLLGVGACSPSSSNGAPTAAKPEIPVTDNGLLTVVLNSGPVARTLKSWDLPAFQKLKGSSSREKDPESGEVVSWKGVELSNLIDEAMSGLPSEEKAQIDLVILRNASGTQAFVPRFLVKRYPLLMAWDRGHQAPGVGPWYSVVPWTSKPKILEENLPLERYFVPGLRQVELTNYRNLYSAYFLKKQTDPLAMRGEKIFMQNCLGCHSTSQAPNITHADATQSRVLASQGQHGTVKGVPRLGDKQWRALVNYFDAFKTESGAPKK